MCTPAGVAQPRDAHPVAGPEVVAGRRAHLDDLPDHLVAGRHGVPVNRKIALGDVQVGAAHPQARTATSNSGGWGRGTSAVTASRGPVWIGPGRRTRQARIVVGIAAGAIRPSCRREAPAAKGGPG